MFHEMPIPRSFIDAELAADKYPLIGSKANRFQNSTFQRIAQLGFQGRLPADMTIGAIIAQLIERVNLTFVPNAEQ